jgi:hypothetical protein
MDEQCRSEVLDLHRFFEDWFKAKLPDSDEAFQRLGDVLAEGFQFISRAGATVEREELLERLRGIHGQCREPGPPFRIRIEELASRSVGDGFQLATYEEWHDWGNYSEGRLSTALFRRKEGVPNGVEWLHVHETALPPREE